jgi:hypothetical protein
MRTTLRTTVVTGLALAATVLGLPATAHADESPRYSPVGYDVSHPQCGQSLPADPAFAIIGVNGGLATTANDCLAEQWEWASRSTGAVAEQPSVQLYVNTANPGQVGDLITTWPTSGANRYGRCDGSNSAACSYEYGVDRAGGDVLIALAAVDELGGPASGGASPDADVDDLAGYRWWLDVETMNTWQFGGGDARRNNRAALEGMADRLTAVGGVVGLYSTRRQWAQIVGTVPAGSSLYALDSWLAGADSLAGAVGGCQSAPLVGGGRVVLTQYLVGDLDGNHSCAPVAEPAVGAGPLGG